MIPPFMAYTADNAFDLVASAHSRQRLAHAFLISGAIGSGKERLAARIIQLVNCPAESSGIDLFGAPVETPVPELDELISSWVAVVRPRQKSRIISVDDIRTLEHTLQMACPAGTCKFGVLVGADRMNDNAANAFLKTLEEPPANTHLLLLSANPQRLLPTILSRCVRIPLIGGTPLVENGGAELVAALNRSAVRAFGTPIAALQLKAVFSQFLAQAKHAANEAAKHAEKEEIAAYRDGTDGAWLKSREDFHKAAAEAEYLDVRSRLFDVLLAWMADLLRLKTGSGGLDFPACSHSLQPIAERETVENLLKRMSALEELRQTLETNAQEQLALEVGFLKAFG